MTRTERAPTDGEAPPGALAPGAAAMAHGDRAPGALPAAGAPFSELTARRLGPIRRYFAGHPVAMDLVVMAIFAMSVLLGLVTVGPTDTTTGRETLIGAVAGLIGTVALFWRRRGPGAPAPRVVGRGVGWLPRTPTPPT